MWAHVPVALPGSLVGCHLRVRDNQDKPEAFREHSSSWSRLWGPAWPGVAPHSSCTLVRWREMDMRERLGVMCQAAGDSLWKAGCVGIHQENFHVFRKAVNDRGFVWVLEKGNQNTEL